MNKNIKKISHLIILSILLLMLTACVGLDRALTKVTDHTQHPTYTYQDISDGGILILGLVNSGGEVNLTRIIHRAEYLQGSVLKKRKKYKVSPRSDFANKLGDNMFLSIMENYRNERWITLDMMAAIREQYLDRYIFIARIENTYQRRNTSSYKKDKPKKKDKNGNKTNEDVDGPDKYGVTRSKIRGAIISADVFDLAQDIIVWSGTRDATVTASKTYETKVYVSSNNYTKTFPYPDYPSWRSTFKNSIEGLVTHMPHSKE